MPPSFSPAARGRISTSACRLTRLYIGWISSNRAKPSRAEMPSAVAICQAAQLLTAGWRVLPCC
jgi:hypothetical protein